LRPLVIMEEPARNESSVDSLVSPASFRLC